MMEILIFSATTPATSGATPRKKLETYYLNE